MKITIIHPSRQRHGEAAQTAANWLQRADKPHDIEYLLSLDADDNTVAYHHSFAALKTKPGFFALLVMNNRSAIDAINNAAACSTGDILIVVSDDFDCMQHWDTQLLEAIAGRTDFVAKTPDGLQKTLITLPIMDRAYYKRFGYVYHPGYRHMFSDQEMTAVGHMLGKVITLPVLFTHNHYSTGRFGKDDISERNDATWNQGKELFNERLKTNFGIEAPVIPYSSIVWH